MHACFQACALHARHYGGSRVRVAPRVPLFGSFKPTWHVETRVGHGMLRCGWVTCPVLLSRDTNILCNLLCNLLKGGWLSCL